MNNKKIILASASPRRRELLSLADFSFDVVTSDVDEVIDPSLEPCELVMSLAAQKAAAVARAHTDSFVVGADTVVVLDSEILGKPKDKDDAKRMLRSLSGRKHQVYTGVCIVNGGKSTSFYECTNVKFCELSSSEIDAYVASGEPMDKAGAYGIQGKGCVLVEGIEGDYFNVVGFPVSRFYREFAKFSQND